MRNLVGFYATAAAIFNFTIVPNPPDFRVLSYINDNFTIQKLTAQSSDPSANYTWIAAGRLESATVSETYPTTFYKTGSDYEIKCTASSELYGNDTIYISMDADNGTYKSQNNENGIFSYDEIATRFELLELNNNNHHKLIDEEIFLNIHLDRSIDLVVIWILNINGTKIVSKKIRIGGPLSVQTTDGTTISEIGANSNGREVRSVCPSDVCQLLESGNLYELEIRFQAYSIGTVKYGIGNYMFEEFARSFMFVTQIELDTNVIYDVSTLMTDQTSHFEMVVDNFNIFQYNYEIKWSIGNIEYKNMNYDTLDHVWATPGLSNIFYEITILELDITKRDVIYVFILDATFYFTVSMPHIVEVKEEVHFLPESSIDKQRTFLNANLNTQFLINISIPDTTNPSSVSSINYFSDENFTISFPNPGDFVVTFELMRVVNGVKIMLDTTYMNVNVIKLKAYFPTDFPSEGILGQQLDMEVVHNMYYFTPSRALFRWDFGDGQVDNGDESGEVSVSYTKSGINVVQCTVSSFVTDQKVLLTRNVTIYSPIKSAVISAPNATVGPNAVVHYLLTLEDGNPLTIKAYFDDNKELPYDVVDKSFSFSHMYQSAGIYTAEFELRNRVDVKNIKHVLHVTKDIPLFKFDYFGVIEANKDVVFGIEFIDEDEKVEYEKYGEIIYNWSITEQIGQTVSIVSEKYGTTSISQRFYEAKQYCLTATVSNGGECIKCLKSILKCFIPIVPISQIKFRNFENKVLAGRIVDFFPYTEFGSEIHWHYKISSDSISTLGNDWISKTVPFGEEFQTSGRYLIEILANNSVSAQQAAEYIYVIDAPKIINIKLSGIYTGYVHQDDSMKFTLVMEKKTPGMKYNWKVWHQGNIISETTIRTIEFTYTFINYGTYEFEVQAVDTVVSSEPYRLSFIVYQPIIALQIQDIAIYDTMNAIAVNEDVLITYTVLMGNNITFKIKTDMTPNSGYYETADMNYLVNYGMVGTYTLQLLAENIINSMKAHKEIIVQERITGLVCHFNDGSTIHEFGTLFFKPTVYGRLSASVKTGSKVSVSWCYTHNELERHFDGFEIDNDFTFDDVGVHKFIVTVTNELETISHEGIIHIENNISEFPEVSFPKIKAFIDKQTDKILKKCKDLAKCIPVLEIDKEILISIKGNTNSITEFNALLNGKEVTTTQYGDGEQSVKTLSFIFNPVSQNTTITLQIKNRVSLQEQDIDVYAFQPASSLSIVPVDSSVCVRDIVSPAAELGQACHIETLIYSSYEILLVSSVALDLYQVYWYKDDVFQEKTSIHGSVIFTGTKLFDINTMQAILYVMGEPSDMGDQMQIETVPELEWNGIVDIVEFPYSIHKNEWSKGVSLYQNDCLQFYIDVTNAEEAFAVNFTVYNTRNPSENQYFQYYPIYNSGDIFQHKFILVENNSDYDISDFQVKAQTQNKARNYTSHTAWNKITKVAVSKNECTPPKLYLLREEPTIKFYRSKSVLIEINVTLEPKCFIDDYRRGLKKKWFLWHAADDQTASLCRGSSNEAISQSLFTENCKIREEFQKYKEQLISIPVSQWDRGIANLYIPKLNLEIGKHCFCFHTEFKSENTCSDTIASWISGSFEIAPSKLIAYITGATQKTENLNEFCSSSKIIDVDASKSMDPDVGPKSIISYTEDKDEYINLEDRRCSNSQILSFNWTCYIHENGTEETALTKECQFHLNDAYETYDPSTSCFDDINSQPIRLCCNQSVLQLNRNHKIYNNNGLTFDFTVTVSTNDVNCDLFDCSKTKKEPAQETQSISFGIDIPNVEIECNSCVSNLHKRVSHNSMIHISSYLNMPDCDLTQVKYHWTVVQSKNEIRELSRIIPECDRISSYSEKIGFADSCILSLDTRKTTTGPKMKNLIIRQGVLKNGMFYYFNLTLTASNDEQKKIFPAISTLVLSPDQLPQNGYCYVQIQNSPAKNQDVRIYRNRMQMVAVDDKLEFACQKWDVLDEQKPLSYSIGISRLPSSKCETSYCSVEECTAVDDLILYRGNQNRYSTILPIGCFKVCIRTQSKTGSSVTGACQNVNVVKPKQFEFTLAVWLKIKTNHLGRLVESKEDLATITSFAGSLVSVLNTKDMTDNASQDTRHMNALTRMQILQILNYESAGMKPKSLLESSQMASVFIQLVKHPFELMPLQSESLHIQFLENATELISKTVSPLYNASLDQYHQSNYTIINTIDDLFAVCGFLLEISIDFGMTVDATNLDLNDLFEELTAPINVLTYKIGEWSVSGEVPIIRKYIGGSKLSIRQSRLTRTNYGNNCDEELCISQFRLNNALVSLQNLTNNELFPDLPNLADILNTLKLFEYDGKLFNFDTPLLSFEFRKFMGESSIVQTKDLENPIRIELPREARFCRSNQTVKSIPSRKEVTFHFNTTKYISLRIMAKNKLNTYDLTKNGVKLTVDKTIQILRETVCDTDNSCEFVQNTIFRNVLLVKIENLCEFIVIEASVEIYEVQCKYYNDTSNMWMDGGLQSGIQSWRDTSVCLTNHLTTFGALTIPTPNSLDFVVKDLNPSNNIEAVCLLSGLITVYIILMLVFRYLDNNDLKFLSSIPLCGQDGAFTYEITIKTGMGWTAGTTANVGIRLYGTEYKSGSRHLSHDNEPFRRGMIDIFQIATDESLGEITKLKVWHDNTGLNPPWFLSRIIVKDLQSKKRYYFLVDNWLHISPYDARSSVEKEIYTAHDDDLSLFSEIFKAQKDYLSVDSHLWTSILTRPTRSRFTRVMRLTVAWTCLFVFILLTMVWFRLDYGIPRSEIYSFWFDASDVVTGMVASILVFPLAIILSFLFKQSRSINSYVWPSRPPTGIVVPMEIEIPSFCAVGPVSGDSGDTGVDFFTEKEMSSQSSGLRRGSKFTENSSLTIEESSLAAIDEEREESTGPGLSKTTSEDSGVNFSISSNMTSSASNDVEMKYFTEDTKSEKYSEIKVYKLDDMDELNSIKKYNLDDINDSFYTSDQSTNECLLPHFTIKVTFLLTWTLMLMSSLLVYLYSAMFGSEQTARWMLSLTFCIFISFVILEPLKIIFLSLFNSIRGKKCDPCETDNIVEFPRVEKSPSSMSCQSKSCKVSPPQGFALEKAKETAYKLLRWNKLKNNGLVKLTLFVTVIIALCNEHLHDDNILNKHVAHQTMFLEASPILGTKYFYTWLDQQCTAVSDGIISIGDIYLIRKPMQTSYRNCYDGFFSSDIDFSNGCGDLYVLNISSNVDCFEQVYNLAKSNWFYDSIDRVIAFRTMYAAYVNRMVATHTTFRRVESGVNLHEVFQKTHSSFFHNWASAFKFSVVLQIIFCANAIYECSNMYHKYKLRRNNQIHNGSTNYKIFDQFISIALSFSSCIIYLVREIYMENATKRYRKFRDGSKFLYPCQIGYILSCNYSMMLFMLFIKSTSLLRFVKGWHKTNTFICNFFTTVSLPFVMFMFLLVVLAYISLLAIGEGPYIEFASALGGLASSLFMANNLTEYERPFMLFLVLGIFYICGRCIYRGIFSQSAVEEYRNVKLSEKLHSQMEHKDYELIDFVWNRTLMYLGLKKQKKIRHHVRFEGMITPLSRGSSFIDEFVDMKDDLDDQKSAFSDFDDIFVTDSESSLTKESDSSAWTTSKLISENNSIHHGPIEPLHMDYIIMKLMDDSIPKLESKIKKVMALVNDIDILKDKSISIGKECAEVNSLKISKRAKSEPIISRSKVRGNVFPGLRKSSTLVTSPTQSVKSAVFENYVEDSSEQQQNNKRQTRGKTVNNEKMKKRK